MWTLTNHAYLIVLHSMLSFVLFLVIDNIDNLISKLFESTVLLELAWYKLESRPSQIWTAL